MINQIKTKSMQDNNLYRQVEFEEEFDLISNIGDKFVYLKKVEADQQELTKRIKEIAGKYIVDTTVDEYEQKLVIGGMFMEELQSKFYIIPKQ